MIDAISRRTLDQCTSNVVVMNAGKFAPINSVMNDKQKENLDRDKYKVNSTMGMGICGGLIINWSPEKSEFCDVSSIPEGQ